MQVVFPVGEIKIRRLANRMSVLTDDSTITTKLFVLQEVPLQEPSYEIETVVQCQSSTRRNLVQHTLHNENSLIIPLPLPDS